MVSGNPKAQCSSPDIACCRRVLVLTGRGNGFDTKNRIVFCIVIWVPRYFVPLNLGVPNRLVRAPASRTGPVGWLVPPLAVCYPYPSWSKHRPPLKSKADLKWTMSLIKCMKWATFGVSMRCDAIYLVWIWKRSLSVVSYDCEPILKYLMMKRVWYEKGKTDRWDHIYLSLMA
jgi:hypothetical protein